MKAFNRFIRWRQDENISIDWQKFGCLKITTTTFGICDLNE